MSNLMTSVLKSIQDNLPETSAGVLKDFVLEATEKKVELERVSSELSDLRYTHDRKVGELTKEVELLKKKVAELQALQARELEIEKRERNIELTTLKAQFESCRESREVVVGIANRMAGGTVK